MVAMFLKKVDSQMDLKLNSFSVSLDLSFNEILTFKTYKCFIKDVSPDQDKLLLNFKVSLLRMCHSSIRL